MKLQTIKQNGQAAFVVVSVAEWDALMARLEEREDIADAKSQYGRMGGAQRYPSISRLLGGYRYAPPTLRLPVLKIAPRGGVTR